MYRPGSGDDWQPVPKTLAGYSMDLLRVEPDGNTAYATITDKGEPTQLYKVDLAKASRVRLAGRNDLAISTVLYAGRGGTPFGVIYEGAKPSVEYFDPASEWAGLHAGLMKAFPGQMVSVLGWTRENGKALIYTWSDRNPGAWHVFDRSAKKLIKINEAMPWLKAENMAPSMPFTFKSRDGLTLHGFITARPGGDRHPDVLGDQLRADLVAQFAHRRTGRADERYAQPLNEFDESRVLCDEAPADPDRVGSHLLEYA